jgi:7,8-dihydropterin-6-yl-methyl-4-(beta-D-ribofuranosyl)aminobenzene 5'-phosphate synthase
MIGGFHLFNKSDDYVRAFVRRLGSTGVESIYTGHCTGDRAMTILREELGEIVHSFRTGLVFEI